MQDFAPGTVIGHYQLIRKLGQGGMGVVYEAVDQKLGRQVAVKFLVESIRGDRTALERFWREARTASALNHPGICIIYELNDAADTPFIVMELLEGESLDQLYARQHSQKSLPLPQLAEIGTQIADALDAAHRKGILHRDIKPANIFISLSGQVKLLDFGLAKREEALEDKAVRATGPNNAPTAVQPLTSSGSSVGTVAYMSPEQARGEPLDARSDIFSLGVVLYEGSTGQHPFVGTTTAVTFDRILNHPPVAPVTLNPEFPPDFIAILNKTLEKDRELRCQSAAELRADLKRMQRTSSGAIPATVPTTDTIRTTTHTRKTRAIWTAFFLMLALFFIVAAVATWHLLHAELPFSSITVEQVTNIGTIEKVALSSDGRFLAEVKKDKGERTLWIRNTATNTDTQILAAFANDYVGLTFSPDGNYLYFARGTPEDNALRSLYTMPVFGGTPRLLIHDVDSSITFAPDGHRVAFVKWTPERKDQFSEVHIADKDGSNDQVLCAMPGLVEAPVWSPDGKRIAWLGAVGTSTQTALHWIDVVSKKVTAVPVPAHIIFPYALDDHTTLAWLPDSRNLISIYYKPRSDRAQIGVVSLDSGALYPITNDVNAYSELAISADGRTLATVLSNVDSAIDLYKPDGSAMLSRLPLRFTPSTIAWQGEDKLLYGLKSIGIGSVTTGPNPATQNFDLGDLAPGAYVSACPDGHILFTALPKGQTDARLFRINADGSDQAQLTTTGVARAPYCSSDSTHVFYSIRIGAQVSMWTIPIAGGVPAQVLAPDNYSVANLSPDQHLAAIILNEVANINATITDITTHRTLPPLAIDESVFPNYFRFSPDSRALVYAVRRNGGNTLLYQPIQGLPAQTTTLHKILGGSLFHSEPAPHLMLESTPDTLLDFQWSPSGSQLALVRVKTSSDIVLITDQKAKNK